jgi:hypothetical protein
VEKVNEALSLLRRQAELKQSMKEAGGIRITEEQELLVLKRRLAIYPQGHSGGRAGRSGAASVRHGSDRRGCRVLGANEFFLKSCRSKISTKCLYAWVAPESEA